MYYLNIDDIITKGKYSGKTVKDIIENKKAVFEALKDGNFISEDVLNSINISKKVRNVSYKNEIVTHEKHNKIYPKDTTSLNKILKELETLSIQDCGDNSEINDIVKTSNEEM